MKIYIAWKKCMKNVCALQFRSKAFWINKCIFIYIDGPTAHSDPWNPLQTSFSATCLAVSKEIYCDPRRKHEPCGCLSPKMSSDPEPQLPIAANQSLSLPSDQEPQLPGDLDLQLPGTIFHAEPYPELDPDPQSAARLTPSPWPAWTLSPLFLLSAWSPLGGAHLGLYVHQLAYFWSSISHSHSCFQSPGQCLKLL